MKKLKTRTVQNYYGLINILSLDKDIQKLIRPEIDKA